MPFSYVTLAQARLQLAAKLYDTSPNLFWSDDEKSQYIIESLRTWNSATSTWKSEFVFQTSVNITWYDLAAQVNSTRPFTVTDSSLIQTIEYHLLEPLTITYPLLWTGSAQFSISNIINALQRIQDEVLALSGCTITQQTVPAIPGRTFLFDSTIDIRRVAWIPITNPSGYVISPLWPDDEWGLQAFERDFTTQAPGIPSSYRQSTEPPQSFDVDVPPAVPGQYDVLSVNAGLTLSSLAPTLLSVPDDFTWVIKWGALADLLSRESNAKDSLRAQYCYMRYKQGIALLLNSPSILYARIDNLPMDVDSVQNTDNYRPGWQSETAAQPDMMMMAGLNLIGFAPIPDSVLYGITVMAVENAPVPILDGDPLQVGKDDLEAILDYAQHLAMFKCGGAEFMSTIPLLDGFYMRASLHNSKLRELGEFTKPTYELSQLQAETNPVYEEADPISG